MKVKLSAKASSQIDDIIQYTDAKFGTRQAEKYIGNLYFIFELLEDNPHMGQPYRKGWRRCLYASHYLYYRIEGEDIQILEIRNTRQSPPDE